MSDEKPDARERAMAWMAGWKCGASFSVIPDHYKEDPDFSYGWKTGRDAKRLAQEEAQAIYGVVFGTLRAL